MDNSDLAAAALKPDRTGPIQHLGQNAFEPVASIGTTGIQIGGAQSASAKASLQLARPLPIYRLI